jgi:hypothetical protein
MTERKPHAADNAVVEDAVFEATDGAGFVETPRLGHSFWDQADGDGVAVVRVDADPRRGGARLCVSLEDDGDGFEAGASASLPADDALELALALVRTAEACR